MNYWKGNKILLRSLEEKDSEFFFNWNMTDSEAQREMDNIHFPTSTEHVKNFVKRESLDNGSDNHFLVIEDLKGNIVGIINGHSANNKNGTFSYGLGIAEGERRKGYASEAIKLLLNYYFNELRYNKMNTGVYEFNENSIILHEKLGMIKEGQRRKSTYTNGKYWDEILFGITRDEFNKLKH